MISNQTVWVSESSNYCFAPVEWVANSIAMNLYRSGIFETGAYDSIMLGDLSKMIGSQSKFEGDVDNQIVLNPPVDAPSANGVISYARKMTSLHNGISSTI
jgi:hypothetical protein